MRLKLRESPLVRVVVVFAAVTLAARLVFWSADALFGSGYSLPRHVFAAIAMCVLLVSTSAFARLRLERLPLRRPGLRSGWREIGLGMAGWLVPAGIGIAGSVGLGWASITLRRPLLEMVLFGLFLLVLVFVYEALPEELVFRGYLYRNLAEVLPAWATVVAQSGLFTLWAFLAGAIQSADRLVLFVGFGVVLGSVRAYTGSFRVGIGFHLAFQTVAQLLGPTHQYVEIEGLTSLRVVAFVLLPFVLIVPLLNLIRLGGRSARAWLVDFGCAVAAFLVGALFVFGELVTEPGSPVELRWELIIGGFACLLLLLFRRHWPGWLALGLLPLAALSAVGIGAAAVTLFTVAAYRARRVTVSLAVLYAVGLTVVYLLAIPDADFWATEVYVLFLLAIFIVSGLLVRSQRQLASRAELNQHLRIEEARRLERERIAREMHDVLGHRISLLTLHAGALEYSPQAPPELAEAAGVIRSCAYAAAEDLREVVSVLRAPGGDGADGPQPVLTELPELVEQTRRTGTPVTLDNRLGGLESVPASIGRHVFRVVQEGLTNARKHAPGRPVSVTLEGDRASGLTIELRNPSSDLPGSTDGAGLIGLRERVELVAGRIEHGRTESGDFRLKVWLPWPP